MTQTGEPVKFTHGIADSSMATMTRKNGEHSPSGDQICVARTRTEPEGGCITESRQIIDWAYCNEFSAH